jgi:hypothetical protein
MANTEIRKVEPNAELAAGQPRSALDMMQQIIADPTTTDKAGALKELVLLKEHMEDREARREFFQSFAKVQAELQTVVATKTVSKNDGSLMWMYAPIEDIMDTIEPTLRKYGFSVRFDSEREGTILTAYCYTMHTGGHQESARCHFNAANAKGGDLGALKSAKRGALIEMFGLKIRQDDDARLIGEPLRADEIVELQKAVAAAGVTDLKKFFDFAGAAGWNDIRQGKLSQLHDMLRKKLGRKLAPASAPPPISDDEAKRIREQEAREVGLPFDRNAE